jgi:hypothetical protein
MTTMGTHNMLVVGEGPIYLSHLPMFMAPHDFQVLVQVAFADGDRDPQAEYVGDRRQRESNMYTFSPERFAITGLVEPAEKPARQSFRGGLFRGHLERGGAPLAEDVGVSVQQVVHFRRFERPGARPAALTYLLFGAGAALFLAHFITRPPDFDHVLSVTLGGRRPADEELARGLLVEFEERRDTVAERVREGEQLTGTTGDPPVELQVEVDREFYLETGDLAQEMR